MFSNLTGWHSLIILAIVVLLFGSSKLPALARSLGQSTKILKSEMQSTTPAESGRDAPVAATPESPEPASRL
ncbi:twin-arginine translocase TatA/TatE family subunit [Cryobacterium sp. M23]|uniref:twin-arginine translocase TatA/TatE family subunit n=1 Tax=Cryobacterium sp. M23 TaxID=2048292 RepID=UPI000CE39245|nr:twin-arginine translocase TatA/TatE family subunit [Cryobacterium sp. M23]